MNGMRKGNLTTESTEYTEGGGKNSSDLLYEFGAFFLKGHDALFAVNNFMEIFDGHEGSGIYAQDNFFEFGEVQALNDDE